MKIIVNDGIQIDEDLMQKLKNAADLCIDLEDLNLDKNNIEVSLSFVSLDEIHELNREYRDVDKPTDVLSFPMFDTAEDLEAMNSLDESITIPLGDVVICMDKVNEQAKEFGHSEERETVYLFTHSILHLLGYDHMTDEDKCVMRSREDEVMQVMGIER